MSTNYSHAIAFIFEGDTEKVFYLNMLEYFCSLHTNWKLQKNTDYSLNEKYYSIQTDAGIVLVKTYVVGTISQVANADTWFNKRCKSIDSLLSWTVFLCYDTDNYSANISKFYEGDWKELRKIGFRNQVFATLEKVMDRLCDAICTLTPTTIKSITGRSWIIRCFN